MSRPAPMAWALFLALAFAFLPAASVLAEDEPPQPSVIQHWSLWPKPGHTAEFESAMKEFVAWRKAQDEGFRWFATQTLVGQDLVPYVFRAGPFHWADLDAQQKWADDVGVAAKYQELVAPHVDRIEHYLNVLDREHSLWYESDEYRYWGVSLLKLEPGAQGAMTSMLETIRKIAADAEWKPGWNVQWIIGGSGPDLAVVSGFRSFAEMAPAEKPFPAVLGEALGSEREGRELLQRLNASFVGGEYLIVGNRPDLSTPE